MEEADAGHTSFPSFIGFVLAVSGPVSEFATTGAPRLRNDPFPGPPLRVSVTAKLPFLLSLPFSAAFRFPLGRSRWEEASTEALLVEKSSDLAIVRQSGDCFVFGK